MSDKQGITFLDFEPGRVLTVYSQSESSRIEEQWMKVYASRRQGLNTKAYKWHVFSGGAYPCLEGDEARSLYDVHAAVEYIILANDFCAALATDERPTRLSLNDVYVFPKNLAWTMAFTHEEGWLGPYFAKHRNYSSLEKENARELAAWKEKQRQIEVAKARGWM